VSIQEVYFTSEGGKVLVSAKIYEDENSAEYVYLIKDDNGEYYLVRSLRGWVQVSGEQKNWGRLINYRYYVDKNIVPLLYYILVTNPQQIDKIFEFLYNENFITYEEENQ